MLSMRVVFVGGGGPITLGDGGGGHGNPSMLAAFEGLSFQSGHERWRLKGGVPSEFKIPLMDICVRANFW